MKRVNRESRNIKQAVAAIKKSRPTSSADFYLRTGYELVDPLEGAFRKTYRISGLPLIVKFPLSTDPADKTHSRLEVKKLIHFRKFKVLRPHLPKLHYFDHRAGIVVMEYVNNVDIITTEEKNSYGALECKFNAMSLVLGGLIKALTGKALSDINSENTLLDKNYILKFVDLAF